MAVPSALKVAVPIALAGAVVLAYVAVGPLGSGEVKASGRSGRELAPMGIRNAAHESVTDRVSYLPLGRARLDLVSRHPAEAHWGGLKVSWYLGDGTDGRLRRVRIGRTRETEPGVTRMTTTVFLPRAGRFRFGACFGASLQDALGLGSSHGPCGVHLLRDPTDSPYVGAGVAPAGYPSANSIDAASTFEKDRAGYTSFAVIDSEGRMHGRHVHRTFVSASVVKAMLLVAYLRKVAGEHQGLAPTTRSVLQSMIHISDNDAATAVWELDGDRRLRALARRAGMTDFSIEGEWGNAQISAADQARYFFEMDSLVPNRFRHLADHLLSHIAGYESWGIPHVARPRGWTTYFKGGWRGTWRGQLVHQTSRLQKPHERLAIAVMTDGDPSMEYGIGTIQGVAERLLAVSR